MIITTSLEKALSQLKISLDYANSTSSKTDPSLYAQFRSACIQSFEFSFELVCKLIKKYVVKVSTDAALINTLSYPDLIRKALQLGVLQSSLKVWLEYRDARNSTSHTYDESIADKVFEKIPEFYQEALSVVVFLKSHNVD